jgi:hypothetical protein
MIQNKNKIYILNRIKIFINTLQIYLIAILACTILGCNTVPSEDEIINKIGSDEVAVIKFDQSEILLQFSEDVPFVSKSLPSSNSGEKIYGIEANSNIINGGSTTVTLDLDTSAEFILINVKDDDTGYFKHPISLAGGTSFLGRPKGTIDISFGNNLPKNVILEFRVSSDDDKKISDPLEHTFVVEQVQTGKLHISLAFDKATDLDLHVFEPNGFDIHWADRKSPNGGRLDLDSNPGCSLDRVNNENTFWKNDVKSGTYRIILHYFEKCGRVNEVNWIITAKLGEQTTQYKGTFTSSNEYEYWEIARIEVP